MNSFADHSKQLYANAVRLQTCSAASARNSTKSKTRPELSSSRQEICTFKFGSPSIVCFRQRCVIEKSGLFLHGRSGKYPAHGGATDVEATGDLGFAKARASKLANLIGMHGCGCGPAEALAVQPSMS